MALVRPFKALRPTHDKANLVAALPYDVMNSIEAKEMAKGNPYSFLHVDKAEIDLDESINIYDDSVYKKAAENLNKMCSDGILIKDQKPCFYVYCLTRNGHTQTGLVCCTSIDEYLNGTIKKHELTLKEKETDRTKHIEYCNANTGPVFLTYKADDAFEEIKNITETQKPVYNFVSDDNICHRVWIIDDEKTMTEISENFKSVKNLYIADGHHRNAAAVNVGLKKRTYNPHYTGTEEFNYFLSVIFPSGQLKIMDYNRIVRDLNGLSKEKFIADISKSFIVSPYEKSGSFSPTKPHQFGMYLMDKWYVLTFRGENLSKDIVDQLDVSILYNNLIKPMLGIGDVRTDKRIGFVGGIRGVKELEKTVLSGQAAVAFSMYPTSIEELMCIADQNKIMPPKSTWFEPKLRSGLFIHSLG